MRRCFLSILCLTALFVPAPPLPAQDREVPAERSTGRYAEGIEYRNRQPGSLS